MANYKHLWALTAIASVMGGVSGNYSQPSRHFYRPAPIGNRDDISTGRKRKRTPGRERKRRHAKCTAWKRKKVSP